MAQDRVGSLAEDGSSVGTRSRRSGLDRLAIALSGLCFVHCLAGSLLLIVFAVAGGLWSHEVHAVGFGLALPLAAVALWRGYQSHGRRMVLLLGAVGLFFMLAALVLEHGTGFELGATMAGVTLLSAAHLLNLRWMGDHGAPLVRFRPLIDKNRGNR